MSRRSEKGDKRLSLATNAEAFMLKQKHERDDDSKNLAAPLRRSPADQVDRGVAQLVERVA
jgi:hypothetical protein